MFIHLAVAVFIMKYRYPILPVGNIMDSPSSRLTVNVNGRPVYRLFA